MLELSSIHLYWWLSKEIGLTDVAYTSADVPTHLNIISNLHVSYGHVHGDGLPCHPYFTHIKHVWKERGLAPVWSKSGKAVTFVAKVLRRVWWFVWWNGKRRCWGCWYMHFKSSLEPYPQLIWYKVVDTFYSLKKNRGSGTLFLLRDNLTINVCFEADADVGTAKDKDKVTLLIDPLPDRFIIFKPKD